MVAYPNHVPDAFKTAVNAEHVELHDSTTDAVVALTEQLAGLALDDLGDVATGSSTSSTTLLALDGDGTWKTTQLNLGGFLVVGVWNGTAWPARSTLTSNPAAVVLWIGTATSGKPPQNSTYAKSSDLCILPN